jgi:ABC-type transport system involved in multi-copper enzyme maturation permease subunit
MERELRVAARKRGTIWFRVLAALVALVIGSGFLVMNLAVGTARARFGSGLFGTLTWMALGPALAAGIFFTADCLSEEKREGTLGFLFLTDLRGYDVVVGKLLATSLRGAYALLAIFPVLAITLLMGGVTGVQFWKSSLALVNALFCSLSAGLLVSSASRNSQRAMACTFSLLLLVCIVGPVTDGLRAGLRGTSFNPSLSLASPAYVFWASTAFGRTAFWSGLLTSHLLGWLCFALASWLVVRTWQDRPARHSNAAALRSYALKYGNTRIRATRRYKLMDPNPVTWLALRERWQSVGVWVLAVVVLCPFVAISTILPPMAWIVWSQVSWLVVIGLYLWTASQACRFFVEAGRTGLLELIMVTPLKSEEVIAGQWRALLRTFGAPVSVLLVVQFAECCWLSTRQWA